MRKVFLSILTIILFLFSLNLFSQVKPQVEVKIVDKNGNVKEINRLALFTSKITGKYETLSICYELKAFVSLISDLDDAHISTYWKAKIVSGSIENNNYTFAIYDPTNNQTKYIIEKRPEWIEATLRENKDPFGEDTSELNSLFIINKTSSHLILTKRGYDEIRNIKMFDISGKVLYDFDYDNSQYMFEISGIQSGMYLISVVTNDKKYLLKYFISK